MQIDPIPLGTNDTRRKTRTERLLCLCVGAFGLAIGSAYVLADRSTRDMRQREALLDREYADVVRQIQVVQEMKDQEQKIAEQAGFVRSLVEKIPRSNLLAELTNALPSGVYLVSLELDSQARDEALPNSGQGPATGSGQAPSIGSVQAAPICGIHHSLFDVRLKLSCVTGSDEQASQFVSKLSHSKLLRDVTLLRQGQAHVGPREYHIELALDPEAEIHNEPAIASAGTFAQK